jgi:GNAT superfamily N-acetyltransferase
MRIEVSPDPALVSAALRGLARDMGDPYLMEDALMARALTGGAALWVDKSQRGTGLGRRLLAAVRDEMAARWGGSFLRLNYYADNPGAAEFYARLGFQPKPAEIWVSLEGKGLEAL